MSALFLPYSKHGGVRRSREGVAQRVNSRTLNALATIFIVASLIMLGKSCWISLKAEVAQVLLERAFTQSLITGQHVKAWNWADTWPVAKIEVKRLNASAIVLQGGSGEALAFGPALLNETSQPGERGTSVIAAHRDTHFAFLQHVKRGDIIEVTRSDGLSFNYAITSTRIASAQSSGIDRHAKGFNLVLSTCYPFGGVTQGDQRYLVEAALID